MALIKPIGLSNQFALPNKIFEYAVCGVPVLASNLVNMQSYVGKHKLGMCVNDYSLSEQINAIKLLLKMNRHKLQERAVKYLSWDVQEKEFLEVIYN